MNILVIDVGGTSVKFLATGQEKRVKIQSGPNMTPTKMVKSVRGAVADWNYDAISIGFPGPVKNGQPAREPKHLGHGWVGFNFTSAFGNPVKIINDAAMQALGSYEGGRMLFLGLGTGLGTTLIIDGVIAPMELAHLPYRNGRSYEEYVGKAALERFGRKKWRRHVRAVIQLLGDALVADDIVLGGGNAKYMKKLPTGVRFGHNEHAFVGGYRLWASPVQPSTP